MGFSMFETAARLDGSLFVRCADGAPTWVLDAVREAHDGSLPDDMTYAACADVFADLVEASAWSDLTDVDAWPVSSDVADRVAGDGSYADVLAWLDPSRVWVVDEFVSEYGWATDGLMATVQGARYMWVERIAAVFVGAVVEAFGEYCESCEADGLDAHGLHMWMVHGCPAGVL